MSKIRFVTADLNTLLTALYVKIDDKIVGARCIGRPPLLGDSELVCPAVAQAGSASAPRPGGCGSPTPHLAGLVDHGSLRPPRRAYTGLLPGKTQRPCDVRRARAG